jgi:hypothetical protein
MWSLAITAANPPQIDRVLFFGFLSMVVWLLCHKEQRASRAFVFGLAVSSAMLMVFALLQPGAWPLGFVQATLTVSAFRRWRKPAVAVKPPELSRRDTVSLPKAKNESRTHRLFGAVGSDN